MVYRVHLAWAGFELTTLVVIGTDFIGSCKSNYHAITTTTNKTDRHDIPEILLKMELNTINLTLKIVTKQQKGWNFDRRKTLLISTISLNYHIVSEVRVTRSVAYHCFVLFRLVIVLHVLRFTASEYLH
jgi:hypothetical protein